MISVDGKEIPTFRLNSFGKPVVLAKKVKGSGSSPVTYANMTQANRKVQALTDQGVNCHVIGDRPYYVAFEGENQIVGAVTKTVRPSRFRIYEDE